MSKLRKTILIIGIIIVAVAASLGTALALYATGSMKTDPIELVYVLREPEAKEYDGTPLKLDDPSGDIMLKKGKLSSGHYAEVEFLGSQTNVGTSMSDASIKIYDEKGFNVTGDYAISVIGAPLTVYPKTISVELPSQKVVYNGSKVLFTEYKTENELVAGHRIYGSTEAALINVGDTLPENLTPLIFDAVGNDVTANYDIDFDLNGVEIEVIPRPVTVRPVSYEKVYDGETLIADEIEFVEGSLVEGQTCVFSINEGYGQNKLTDVDEIETQITSLKIYCIVDGEEVDVTENYDFNLLEYTGYLKITPRPLTVTAKSAVFEYNGEEQSLSDDNEALKVEGLAPADEFIGVTYFGSRKNVGVTENAIAEVNLKGLAENYDIRRIAGTIEITPKELVFVTSSAAKYYDGDPLYTGSAEYELVNERQSIELDGDGNLPSITNVGEIPNAYTVSVVENGEDCTENYDISYEYGTLTVKILPVKVTLKNGADDRETVNYDSKTHSPTLEDEKYFSVEPILKDGEKVEKFGLGYADFEVAAETRAMTDAGEYYYTVKFKDKKIEDRQLYSNYDLYVPESGVLEITALPVSVEIKEYTDTLAFTYSGKAVKLTATDAIKAIALRGDATLPEDVQLAKLLTKSDFVVVSDEITDAGEEYYYTVKIADAKIAANFDVAVNDLAADDKGVKVEVNPMPVTLTLTDVERTYDGKSQTVDVAETVLSIKRTLPVAEGVDVNETAGLTKNDLKIEFNDKKEEHTNADEYEFVVTALRIKAQNNYAFTIESKNDENEEREHALLKISPKKVAVTVSGGTIVYGDKEMPEDGFTLDCGELPNGEKLTFTTHLENTAGLTVEPVLWNGHILMNAGDYRIKPNNDKAVTGGNGKLSNYDFDFGAGGSLTVKPCPVTVKTDDREREYNGSALRYKSAQCDTLFNANLSYPADDKVASITDVGKTANEFEVDILCEGVTVKGNYLITYSYGTLEVTQKDLKVTTGSLSKTYDGKPLSCDDPTSDGLITGHKLKISQPFSILNATDAAGVDNAVEYTVLDGSGKDVGKNYKIEYVAGKLTINRAVTTFSLSNFATSLSVDMTYDGKQKKFDVKEAITGITIGGKTYTVGKTREEGKGIAFAESDFEIEYSAPVIESGRYTYTVKFADAEFEKNFKVANADMQMSCSVQVTKKPVVISVRSFTDTDAFVYDHQTKTFEIDEVLLGITDNFLNSVDEEVLSASDLVVVYPEEMLNAGEYIYKVKITDEYAKNFSYIEAEGEVTILKLDVDITLADHTLDYSGSRFEIPQNSVNVINLVLNDSENLTEVLKPEDFTLAVDGGEEIKNAGTYTYGAVISDETKARNFNVSVVSLSGRNATVTIEKLYVDVALRDLTFTFDGTEHEIKGEDALDKDEPLLSFDDFTFTVWQDGAAATLLKHGDYTYEATLTNGNFILLDYEDGVITDGYAYVEKGTAKVTLNNLFKEYDGEEFDLAPQKSVVVIDGKEYTSMQSRIASVECEIFTMDDFVLVYSADGDHSNADEYDVEARLCEAYEQFEDSIDITTENGKVKIGVRKVTVTTPTKSFVYNGEARSASDAEVIGAVAGHYAKAVEESIVKVTDVGEGEVYNKFDLKIYRKTVGEGGEVEEDVTDNYEIDEANSAYGYISVTPAEITVYLKEEIKKSYAGLNGNIGLTGSEAISGVEGNKFPVNDFAVAFDGDVINVGTYPFTLVFKDADTAENYEIKPEGESILTVTAARLNVTLKSYTGNNAKAYTGEVQSPAATDVTVSASNNFDGITATAFKFITSEDMLNAGTYTYGVELEDLTLKDNYDVNFDEAEWQIAPAKITVTLKNYTKVYNGTTYTVDVSDAVTDIKYSGKNEACGLLEAKDFRIKYVQELRLANNYYEVLQDGDDYDGPIYLDQATNISYKILTEDVYKYEAELIDEQMRNNFDVSFEGGDFKINKRALTFTASMFYLSKLQYETGGYASDEVLEVKSCISVSPNTVLADGDQLVIRSAIAERDDLADTVFTLYALTDYTLTNEGCYEFTNLTGDINDGLTIQIVITNNI